MFRLLIVILICVVASRATAQIIIQNGTFDAPGCDEPNCFVEDWIDCFGGGWAILSPTIPSQGDPKNPFLDSTFLGLWEGIYLTQKLDCSFKQKKTYALSIAVSSYLMPPVSPQAILGIYTSNDSCSFTELLYRSEYLEYEWSYRKVLVTPANDDYSFIVVRADEDTSQYFSRLFVDALSDLYKHNGNAVHIQNITDTTIQPGACVQLQATADISTFDTVFWLKKYPVQDGFRIDTIRNTFTLNDCPTASTTYIIALRDSVPDCAGIWWSYDTVRVTVNTGTVVAPLSTGEGLGVRLFPNPTTNTLTIQTADHHIQQISICDVTGKSILSQQMKETTQTTILLQGVINTTGVYVAEITFTNGLKQRIKFLKQ